MRLDMYRHVSSARRIPGFKSVAMPHLLFAGTIFTSAFLLFLVQPLISKHILPWFGGSAAVWATCMVFFQVLLLAGYAYADWSSRTLRPRPQVLLHAVLIAISLATLTVLPGASWKPDGSGDPTLQILALLAASIGLPYFILSTTGPLVQSWVSRSLADARVYRYFSLSNLASLVALVGYPFLVEPRAALVQQASAWSLGYGFFALCCVGAGLYFALRPQSAQATSATPTTAAAATREAEATPMPGWRAHLRWLALSAMGSWLLLAITNHLTQNVAAIPFLWLLPLVLYLLTFVLCFESDRWYSRQRLLAPTAVLLLACAYSLQPDAPGIGLRVAIALYGGGLFLLCMFLHGELAQLRPAAQHLTRFYLMLSIGGALGGIAVGLVAPRVLPAYYELGLGFIVTALLAAWLLKGRLRWAAWACALFCAVGLYLQVADDVRGSRTLSRSFYGTVLTADVLREHPVDNMRRLFHGSVKHGEQYLDPSRRREATAYYGASSGVGLAIANARTPNRKVGLIGLGAGTLALYGQSGDQYRFYEINPQVIALADTEFSFMRDSAARIDMVLGDARLSLEKEPPQQFDVLAVDAFSGDSIPVHLITREAMAVYLRHLAPQGVIAMHVTNSYLRLAPVVLAVAQAHGLHAVLVHDEAENTPLRVTDWVLVARDPALLQAGALQHAATAIAPRPELGVWTDDFNNLFAVLK
jgi:hypothetical protein